MIEENSNLDDEEIINLLYEKFGKQHYLVENHQ